jgi:hypothetical protein
MKLNEINKEIAVLLAMENSFITNLEILINTICNQRNQRNDISMKIEQLIKKENEIIKYKYTIEDMIFIINEYHFKNAGNSKKKNTSTTSINQNNLEDYNEMFELINRFNSSIDNQSFIQLNSFFLTKGQNLSTEMIVCISKEKLKEIKESVEKEHNRLSEFNKMSLETVVKMIFNKIDILTEQNKLILNLNSMLKNIKNDVNIFHESRPDLKKLKEQMNLNNYEEDPNYIKLNKSDKLKYKFNSNVKDIIISFLKEAIYHDDPFLRYNQTNKSLKVDFAFEKNKNIPQILVDNYSEMEHKKLTSPLIREDRENKYNLNDLICCQRRDLKKNEIK